MRIEKRLLLICLIITCFQMVMSVSYGVENYSNQSSKIVLGEWQQFVYTEGNWKSLGIYLVDKKQDKYLMTPVEQTKGPDITNSRCLFDVDFKGDEWHFKSDWGQGKIGEFKLNKIAPASYMGWSYLNGQQFNQNLWLHIK